MYYADGELYQYLLWDNSDKKNNQVPEKKKKIIILMRQNIMTLFK